MNHPDILACRDLQQCRDDLRHRVLSEACPYSTVLMLERTKAAVGVRRLGQRQTEVVGREIEGLEYDPQRRGRAHRFRLSDRTAATQSSARRPFQHETIAASFIAVAGRLRAAFRRIFMRGKKFKQDRYFNSRAATGSVWLS